MYRPALNMDQVPLFVVESDDSEKYTIYSQPEVYGTRDSTNERLKECIPLALPGQRPGKRRCISENVVNVAWSASTGAAINLDLIEVGTMAGEWDFVNEAKSKPHEEELKGDICRSRDDLEGALFHYEQACFLNQGETIYRFKKAACLERLNLSECLKFLQSMVTRIEDQITKARGVSMNCLKVEV
eukprot:Protomagalhaensia_sp_Gyna_25__2462@NODE_2374_length_1123_cov_10_799815_g1968_i0_p1_GENE_NODE_2374_length_1123_cov_10_799815_g1968_i0NODE_2374_length_1123_cov_10_799815_g1968_i0_p1_ORF_typecomplete_len186_score25_83_NODE_2374_length_1123_cov_10_799815_g1968_i018575